MMNEFMSIGELAKATDVSPHTLRYYEKIDLMPNVERTEHGSRRLYGPRFIHWVKFLRRLRAAGMPIKTIRKYVACFNLENEGWPQRREILNSHKEQVEAKIAELQDHLKHINEKLALGCDPGREAGNRG